MRRAPFAKAIVLLLAVALGGLAGPGHSQTHPQPGGWLWYQDPAKAAPPQVQRPATPTAPSPAPTSAATPAARPYSTAWVKENLDRLRDLAIEQPTPENVRAYLLLQRLAVDRSQRFAEMSMMVTQGDPALDENSRFPIASAAAQQQVQNTQGDTVNAIQSLTQQAGLFFFFRSDCPYCHQDLSVLRTLALTTGIKITAISLDGANIDPEQFPNYVIDSGQAARLGVQATPAFFLVRPPNLNDVVELGQGYLSLPDMQQRIVEQAYYHGWLDTDLYKRTRIAAPVYVREDANSPGAGMAQEDLRVIEGAVARASMNQEHLPSTPLPR